MLSIVGGGGRGDQLLVGLLVGQLAHHPIRNNGNKGVWDQDMLDFMQGKVDKAKKDLDDAVALAVEYVLDNKMTLCLSGTSLLHQCEAFCFLCERILFPKF